MHQPRHQFEAGLGVFGVTRLKVVPSLRLVAQMFSKQPKIEGDQVVRDDNADCVRVTCADPPMASQFDGDYLGVRERMTFRAVPDALDVVAPPLKSSPTCGDRRMWPKALVRPRGSVVQTIKGFGNRSLK